MVSALMPCQSWTACQKLLDNSKSSSTLPSTSHLILDTSTPVFFHRQVYPHSQHSLLAVSGPCSITWMGSPSLDNHQSLVAEHPCLLYWELLITSPNFDDWISRLLLVPFLSLAELLTSLSAQRKERRKKRGYLCRVGLVLESQFWKMILFLIFGSQS